MENQIICPNCGKTISNDPIIDDAARKEGSAARSIICDCGERITYWAVTAQLRKQRTPGQRFRDWIHDISNGRF